MSWFRLELKAFKSRLLLLAFVVVCIAGLTQLGIDSEFALGVGIALVALSVPFYLIRIGLNDESSDSS